MDTNTLHTTTGSDRPFMQADGLTLREAIDRYDAQAETRARRLLNPAYRIDFASRFGADCLRRELEHAARAAERDGRRQDATALRVTATDPRTYGFIDN